MKSDTDKQSNRHANCCSATKIQKVTIIQHDPDQFLSRMKACEEEMLQCCKYRERQNSGWFTAVKSFQGGAGEQIFLLNIKML